MPTRDYQITGHDDPRVCACSYHRRLRDIRDYDGPLPDSDHLYDPET